MTTIAYNYKDGEIAVDGRSTRDNVIMSDFANKSRDIDGIKFILCGSTADYQMLIDSYFGAPVQADVAANALVIDGGMVYRIGATKDDGFWRQACDDNDAMGSGWEFALAAMDFGKSAKGAVKYAATRDSCTGGKVRVYKV